MKPAAAACVALAAALVAGAVRGPGPRVVAVHPGLEAVPSNLLRIYIDFSEPMAGGDAFRHLVLRDAAGAPIRDAFREMELWSRGHTRLMAYIHPGRIKRGLAFGTTEGPVLVEGQCFVLELAPGMKARSGRAIDAAFRRELRPAGPDLAQPEVARWRIAASRDGVVVECDEWLDHAGLEDFVRVGGRAGRVEGRRIRFDGPFAPGEHRLTVDPRLEDLAGNSFIRAFETRPGDDAPPIPAVERVLLVR